jgi:alpha-1,3-glucan synthase
VTDPSFRHSLTFLQWFPVESTSTSHMLSQLSKTIKLALASTPEERALLRARSAVQRFPVVEWRQRMEDFHKRSIVTSRHLAADDAWRESDCQAPTHWPNLEDEDWTPEMQADPSRPEWAAGSLNSAKSSNYGDSLHTPSLHHIASNGSDSSPTVTSHFLSPSFVSSRSSVSTDHSDSEPPWSRSQSTDANTAYVHSSGGEPYGDFLARANKQIAKEKKHVGDPFMESPASIQRPFGQNSRRSSVESIASIVEDKADSPLNKAMASVSPLCGLHSID